ncbi:hypothetical protein ACGFX4_29650 [Kitasatospora sp. NPDC048365]|uniref:hypothetical protein n=1 Tax=Kitasatospora sp. NPDC048365 TaxID=3364050 RepID=UPI0037146A6D
MSYPQPPTPPGGPQQTPPPPWQEQPAAGPPGQFPSSPQFPGGPYQQGPQGPYQQGPYQQGPYQQGPFPPGQFPPGQFPTQYTPPTGPEGRPPRRGLRALLIVGGVILGIVAIFAGLVVYKISTRPAPVDLSHQISPWQKLADNMTAALAAKDEEAFLKPFLGDPLREQQRKVFRNLVKIPWEQAKWETEYPTPLNGDMMVTFAHQVKGVDNKPVPERYNWRVQPGTGAPVITEVAGAKGRDGKPREDAYYPAPWDYYPDFAVEIRDNLVAIADQKQVAELKRDIEVMSQAAKDDLAAWKKSAPAAPNGRESARGFFVVLEKDRTVYNKLYNGDGRENDKLEAGVNMPVPAYGTEAEKQLVIGGSRIVMDTSLSRFTSADWKNGVTEISRHEMGHALVEVLATEVVLVEGLQDTQTWVVEGFGDYMAFRGKNDRFLADLRASLQGFAFDGELPESMDFYSKTARTRSANYALGASAVRYMAETYGEDKTFAFVIAHYTAPKEYKQQITTATGRSLEQFQTEWAAYVRAKAPGVG